MSHEHNHNHDHQHESKELSFQAKLISLFQHWIDHNISHKESYLSWAEKAKKENLSDIVQCLEDAGILTDELNSKLEKALKILK
jgi:hypothetical protein